MLILNKLNKYLGLAKTKQYLRFIKDKDFYHFVRLRKNIINDAADLNYLLVLTCDAVNNDITSWTQCYEMINKNDLSKYFDKETCDSYDKYIHNHTSELF